MIRRTARLGLKKVSVDNSLAAITVALSSIDDELVTLARRVDRLESEWSGEAREAFGHAMRDCRATLADLHSIASSVTRVAQGSVARLDEFDRRRASAWHR